jgi:hypothetical protein
MKKHCAISAAGKAQANPRLGRLERIVSFKKPNWLNVFGGVQVTGTYISHMRFLSLSRENFEL